MDSFLAEGKTALPDHAYMMTGSYRSRYAKTPTEEGVRKLFKGSEGFQKSFAGEDYCYGLADVTNGEYLVRYDPLLQRVKEVAHPGSVVELPAVPNAFLRHAPLVDGDLIDRYTLELAEWGACLKQHGLVIGTSRDKHPLA